GGAARGGPRGGAVAPPPPAQNPPPPADAKRPTFGALQQHHPDQRRGDYQVQDEKDCDHCVVFQTTCRTSLLHREPDHRQGRARLVTCWPAPPGRQRDWSSIRASAGGRRPQPSSSPWPWPP